MSADVTGPEGRELGKYRLVRRIAIGGMAEVFEARQEGHDDPVVLKVLLPHLSSDPEQVSMLEDEARLTVGLDHPNLIRVLELDSAGDQWFIVMELVDGPTLAELMARSAGRGRLPDIQIALALARALLLALRYIDDQKDEAGRPLEIVHRDVTPRNVLLSSEGEVKLGDFGIARHRLRRVHTRSGVIKGTTQYMAPEQITDAEVDRRTDIYGVGLILFELLTGRPFISGEREVDLIEAARDPGWIAPSSIRPDVDPGLDRAVQRALERFPEQRYPDAAAFIDALSPHMDQPGSAGSAAAIRAWMLDLERRPAVGSDVVPGPRPVKRVTRQTTAKPEARRRGWRFAVPAALALLALAAASVVLSGVLEGGSKLKTAASDRDPGAISSPDGGSATRIPDAIASTPDLPRARDAAAGAVGLDAAAARVPRRRLPPPRRAADAAVQKTPADKVLRSSPPRPDPPLVARGPTQRREPPLQQLSRMMSRLHIRGIRERDLPLPLQRRLAAWRRDHAAGKPAGRPAALDDLERAIIKVKLDQKLVEAKLRRVDRLLGRQKAATKRRFRDRSARALQAVMDGQVQVANHHLNHILDNI